MQTFTELNTFDWSTMSNDQQPPRTLVKQELPENSMPINNESIWFDKFLSDAEQQLPSNTTTATGSPLEFSSLFDANDDDQPSAPQSLFTSTVTSLDNSPMIKSEELVHDVPTLDLSNASRSTSTTSISSSESTTNTTTTTEAPKKQKKKRAPRKRLTDHQKQAHNKIEKRYRININAKIAGLQQIIPWVASEKTAFETGEGEKIDPDADVPRLNKSMILEKATSYILYLQENENKMNIKLEKLRQEVQRLGGNPDNL